MKKSSAEKTFDKFETWLYIYTVFLNKILSAKRVVSTTWEKQELLEAFVLRVVSVWEIFVEDLIVDCLNKDTTKYAAYMDLRLPKNLPRAQCEAMLNGLGYLDFPNVGSLKSVARNVLVPACNPFQAIPKAATWRIDEFLRMRNYLAHYSTRARRALKDAYRRNHGLTRFREPGDFLYASRGKGGQPRFGDYVDAFSDAAKAMRRFLGV
jgi:hypothetical protein